ncbi:Peroxidase [Bertholletia excelsa]
MASSKLLLTFFQFTLVLSVLGLANAYSLKLDYYKKSCPSAKHIAKAITKNFISRAPSLAAALLRLHFHDCFVRGCDGSVLLNSTKNNKAERDAYPNLSLRGFQVIDSVKKALEKKCPGVVSCADILALVAREAVSQIGGPFWLVPLGRRDGRVSTASAATANLPSFAFNITQLKASFASKGLSDKDLVVLSGGHTIGIAHCDAFSDRLYNFNRRGGTDPTMDQNYIDALKKKCPPGDSTTLVEMDPGSHRTFDAHYYTLVSKRRGLLQSDAALLKDSATNAYVHLQATTAGSTFMEDFAKSMAKMGKIGVLTGSSGEIRKQCSTIN